MIGGGTLPRVRVSSVLLVLTEDKSFLEIKLIIVGKMKKKNE